MLLLAFLVAIAAQLNCNPGFFYWIGTNSLEHCSPCSPGCACPGNMTACYGCNSGYYSSAKGSSVCQACPAGTTTDVVLNTGCDPFVVTSPCSNQLGQLGMISCRPTPPPPQVVFQAPNNALTLPAQYTTNTAPYLPNKVSPYYDIEGRPMLMQSY